VAGDPGPGADARLDGGDERVALGQQRPGVSGRVRVGRRVDGDRAGLCRLRRLVDVVPGRGRHSRIGDDELAHAAVGRPDDGTHGEVSFLEHLRAGAGERALERGGGLAVDVEIAVAAAQRVIDALDRECGFTRACVIVLQI